MLLAVDDVQYAADVTADLVAHLAARLDASPVLLVAAARTEGLLPLARLTSLGETVLLGPLPASAVDALAAAAGFGSRADEVLARSLGHPLSVVASLQALASGTAGVPADIAGAVSAQLALLGDDPAGVAAAASVLGTRVEPVLLGGLLMRPEVEVVLICERLVLSGLMTRSGRVYDFANDLVQEAVLATVPGPLAVAYHRRAADLTADRPEQMARHAHEAGEPDRAAGGYLEAGRRARGRRPRRRDRAAHPRRGRCRDDRRPRPAGSRAARAGAGQRGPRRLRRGGARPAGGPRHRRPPG